MSPNIFKKGQGYKDYHIYFHAGEVLEKYKPSHVHVQGNDYWLELWVPDCTIKDKGNMPVHERTPLIKFIKNNMTKILAKWEEDRKKGESKK